MPDSYREQRPLLCDDYSDEEFDVKSYQRRNRHSVRSGRVRNYAKGAVAVITHWPDTCSTSVAYWWLGVSMIAITIFVVYNSVLIFGMIPSSDMKPPKYRIFNNEINPKVQTMPIADVYMHLVVDNSSDVPLNKYLPYAAVVLKEYPSFNYNFLVVLNDTLKDLYDYKDEERNEIAFNSLWINEKVSKRMSNKYNISIKYISLTAYFNDSPIKKFWRHLPSHLIEFLLRSVSIWEKGGIAFNPKILIPNQYNPLYMEKLYDILNNYVNSSSTVTKIKPKPNLSLTTRRPNNIRDIINDLGKDDNNNISNGDLSEAEDNNVDIISNNDIFKIKSISKRNSKINQNITGDSKGNVKHSVGDIHFNDKIYISNSSSSGNVTEKMLPMFLKYLFEHKYNKVANSSNKVHLDKPGNITTLSDNLISFNQNQSLPVENILHLRDQHKEYNANTITFEEADMQRPIHSFGHLNNDYYNIPELSVDLKGNIVASKIPCHAFLGTMFSNVIQHTEEETLMDFIISELSLFCNGLLTSCAGVNVILI